MRKIYTKTGDDGMTGLRGGVRVAKDDIRIETNGTIDELNASIGVVVAMLPEEHEWRVLLTAVQEELMIVMSHIATPLGSTNPKRLHTSELTARFEEMIDRMALSGVNMPQPEMSITCSIARRAERCLQALNSTFPQQDSILKFMNRLPDLLFAMARNI